jgi:hypothetical protein
MSKVRITDVRINTAKVEIDGVDVSSATRALMFRHEVGHRPELELELGVFDVSEIDSPDVKIMITPSTHEALVALGWTPPASS